MRNNGIILEWLQVRNQLFTLQSFLLVFFGWQTWHNVKKQLLNTCTVSYITWPARPPPFRTIPGFTWPATSLCTIGNSSSQLLGVIQLQKQLCWWSPHLTQPHIKLSMEGSTTIRPIFFMCTVHKATLYWLSPQLTVVTCNPPPKSKCSFVRYWNSQHALALISSSLEFAWFISFRKHALHR